MSDTENLTRDEAAWRSSLLSVSSYDVHVDLSAAAEEGATTFPVTTRVELSFTPAAGEDTVPFLDYIGITVESLKINGQQAAVEYDDGAARLPLPGLVAGENVVEIESVSRYSRSGEGLHRFVDPDGSVYLYSQCESADARRIVPVFDQPDLKARWRFEVTGPENWQLRSNGAEVSRVAAGENQQGQALVTVSFADTPLMSSYLIALLAGPYYEVTDSWSGQGDLEVPLSLLVRKAMAEHLDAEELFTITKQGLDFFHSEFGYDYPWGKYDQVFVPEYNAGAMENPGLVVFTEKLIFDTAATEAQHELRANVVMHEMAHMWFGDLVTMKWWDDLWLKESFADYMGSFAVDEATDFETAWVAFANGRKAWAYVQDQLPTTHPIVADIPDLEAAHQNFDGITYAKGASVLKQLAAYAGREAFAKAAGTYFHRHAFSNTTLSDFLSVLEEATGKDMHAWAEAWLQTAGIPVLSVEPNPEDEDTVLVRQSGTDPVSGAPIARPHVVDVGLHTLRDGELKLGQVIPADLAADAPGGVTPVRLQLPDDETPRLVLPNERDLTYAKLSLDPESVSAALSYPIEDPLARATVWAALWSMVRDGELSAQRYVDAVLRLGLKIPEAAMVTVLLRQANTAAERYAPAELAEELTARLGSGLVEFLANAAEISTAGEQNIQDAQRAAARTLAALSLRHPGQLDLLADLLDGKATELGIEGLEVDEELRWAFLQALTAHGRADREQIDSELAARSTARGRIAHRLALAARPEKSVKDQALDESLNATDAEGSVLSNDLLTATIDGFSADPSNLTAGYEQRYFESLRSVWSSMTLGQAGRIVGGLFPAVQHLSPGQQPEEHPVAAATAEWLEQNSDAPAGLRRELLEAQDGLLRSLRAQAAAHV
ncbi:aminopeptidase N [Nesterenkonia sp. MY13]|uniref:Aminopeptidase N n=1 Tax=Nesterenkonia sedimenti TaxID=1463632 RepID=A0A7X8YCL8_9MICC|nr:aminopeptidase N [Nesterenkonia sedimenti]NLS08709.1 aminopeptidase N [Nesterenkonia sedimenti]